MSTRRLLPADVIAEPGPGRRPADDRRGDEALGEAYGDGLTRCSRASTDVALASASIGQVHARGCARPARSPRRSMSSSSCASSQRAVVERRRAALPARRLVATHVPVKIGAGRAVTEFDRAIAELDYGLEADNATRFARNFEGDATVRFAPLPRGLRKRALVMEAGQH
jgi:hypothetical protein